MSEETGPDKTLEFVITYLEMTERPRQVVHAPSGIKLAILRAEEPTVSFYRYLYDVVGEPWLWWERRALDDDSLAAIIADPKVEVYVLYVAGVPGGFAELDLRPKQDIELAYFGLIPDFIGRGLGRFFLSAAVDTAWAHEPRRVLVNTCNYDHPKAIQTYQRAGFTPYNQERKLVPDPRVEGIIPASVEHPNDVAGIQSRRGGR